MTLPVFIDPAVTAPPDGAGALLAPAGIAHHAVTVRRMGPGEQLQLSDGAGLRLTGTITVAERDRLCIDITAVSREEPAQPTLVLVQALAKGGRDLAAVEAAVEVGVDAVIPWQAQRSIVRWPESKAAKQAAKWQHTAHAAAEQSRRAVVPVIEQLAVGTGLAERFGPRDEVLMLHEAAAEPLTAQLAALTGRLAAGAGPERILVIVGPEGGIGEAEHAALTAAGASATVLGPSVLRASTAGPVALGLIQAALGRW